MAEEITKTIVEPSGLSEAAKLRLLLEITRKISRSLNLEEVLAQVMDTLASLLPYDAAGIYIIRRDVHLSEGGTSSLVFHAEAVRGYDIEELMELRLKLGEGLIGWVAQTAEAVVVSDVRADARYVNARKETRSEVVAPIISNDEVIGVFDLESDVLNAYTEDDRQLLMLLASQVAIIVEKAMLHEQLVEKKRLEAQLEVARQVQLALLPERDPVVEGFDISAYNFSTEEVSGDYYDFVKPYEDHLGLVIADVSGKGVPASLLMAFLRASLRAAIHIGYAPNVAMGKVNYLLWESIEQHQFVTAFYGMLDSTNRTLAFVNAGHNPMLVLNADGSSRFVERGGLPLGLFKDTRYYEYYLPIDAGQTLVLYTDGATEAQSLDGAEYGRDRLVEAVLASRERRAREMIDYIYNDIFEWTGGRGSSDDVTFVIIKAL
ncbi:MAG: phosphoserine phosphatase RsbU/P [Acidobacteriota bacterium]|jgi:sigma-B regulation protein RsbU (phosphoserine phosphatase)|nr:phosphoserine phosphatase RsbU/P [Acidobacteriota bacterium]MDT5261916.1 phosphoserine phosphatase RsbU/P [Acidobacteriota bacterium]MDT7778368.1 phosphoserine phosphatase RsbU/P [Acidobacteriota bacterium]